MKHLSDAEIATGLPGPCPTGPAGDTQIRSMRLNVATLLTTPDRRGGRASAVSGARGGGGPDGAAGRAER